MRNIYYCLFLLLVSYSVMAQPGDRQYEKDSLRRVINQMEEGKKLLGDYSRLTSIYFMECFDELKRDTLFALYDEMDEEARRQGNLDFQGLVRANKLYAYLNNGLYDEVFREAPSYLTFLADHEVWRYYFSTYEGLIKAWLYTGEYEEALKHATLMYERAEKIQNTTGMGTALYTMAKIYEKQNRYDREESCCRQCLQLIEGDETLLYLATKTSYLLCQSLLSREQYEDVFDAVIKYEEAVKGQEKYFRISVPSEWANLYGIYVRLYVDTGEYDKAEIYCDKIDNLVDSPTFKAMTYKARARILNHRGSYIEALEMIDKAMEETGDFYTADANGVRSIKIQILVNMGRGREAYELFEVAAAVRDSVRNLELAAQLDQIHTQYEVNRHVEEKERNRNYFLLALIGCGLLLVILFGWMFYSRRLQMKNRNLVRRLEEQDALKAELKKWEQEHLSSSSADTQGEEDTTAEQQLFRRLEDYLLSTETYLAAELNRKELVTALGTNETYLFGAVRTVKDMSLQEYIYSLRLEWARICLKNNPDKTIERIAAESGFNTSRTFYRHFRDTYGITPSEYRRLTTL